jgi:RNA polymerase sigma-70 factor, ECF subfamily
VLNYPKLQAVVGDTDDGCRSGRNPAPARTTLLWAAYDRAQHHMGERIIAVDDASLVVLAREARSEAFAVLFERYEKRLQALAGAMLGDRELARDVVQDTALVALTGLDQLRNPDLVGAWLHGICRNLCRRRLRSRLRTEWSWSALQGGQVPLETSAPQATPEDEVIRAEAAEAVRRAVAELPEGQRDAVTLFYLDDRSYREVGEQLGLDVNAVKARLHRARRGLRPRFGPQAAAAAARCRLVHRACGSPRGPHRPAHRTGGTHDDNGHPHPRRARDR